MLLVALISLLAAALPTGACQRNLDPVRLSVAPNGAILARANHPGPACRGSPRPGDSDFVIQIWDPFGARVYLSRPGLPLIIKPFWLRRLSLQGEAWRAYGLQTADGVIQIAQPSRVRQELARAAALRVVVPLVFLLRS